MTKGSHRRMFDLTGRVAVVTGGVGILGRHFCAALADHGASVAVVDLDEASCTAQAEELRATYGVAALGVGCDVARPEAVAAMAERVERDLGPVAILHNNAATKTASLDAFLAPLESYTPETWREVMGVNLDGMFLVAQALGSRMAARGAGSIIQTASIYGLMAPDFRIYEGSLYNGRPITTPAAYTASKAGVIGLTKHLAVYWAEQGVRVNCLVPGGVESGQNDTFRQRYAARIPMGRMAEATEMTGALVFLASDAASYVTGQVIAVDGGLSAW
jgi:NAD(P)-dependent dehydrogenase (short-subunit alcohol dehydrogenase family)